MKLPFAIIFLFASPAFASFDWIHEQPISYTVEVQSIGGGVGGFPAAPAHGCIQRNLGQTNWHGAVTGFDCSAFYTSTSGKCVGTLEVYNNDVESGALQTHFLVVDPVYSATIVNTYPTLYLAGGIDYAAQEFNYGNGRFFISLSNPVYDSFRIDNAYLPMTSGFLTGIPMDVLLMLLRWAVGAPGRMTQELYDVRGTH